MELRSRKVVGTTPSKKAAEGATPSKRAAPTPRKSSKKEKADDAFDADDAAVDAAAPVAAASPAVATGSNWVDGGLGDGTWMVPFLLVFCPMFVQVLASLTSTDSPADPALGVSGLAEHCLNAGVVTCAADVAAFVAQSYVAPSSRAVQFLLSFNALALLLDVGLPGPVEYGPETLTGHVPSYKNNALLHCFVFTLVFVGCSSLGLGLFDLGIIYDVFPQMISSLNIFGMALAVFLNYKGLHFPSTADSGTTGSFFKDFTWGTELYPRVFGVDIKRFVNCRFAMTFWMLAPLSFTYKSYALHGALDYGLALGAASQFLYLVKFFEWEIGYMRSIDIIVDRAGWEIQWGCLVWVPSVYTFHSRFCVSHPTGLSPAAAAAIFSVGFSGVLLNYWADVQRKRFREADGKGLIWGKVPVFVVAKYTVYHKDGSVQGERESLLLASGFWGIARHFHYVFELTAAWSSEQRL